MARRKLRALQVRLGEVIDVERHLLQIDFVALALMKTRQTNEYPFLQAATNRTVAAINVSPCPNYEPCERYIEQSVVGTNRQLRYLLAICLCLIACPAPAQTAPERPNPINSQKNAERGPVEDRNSMGAAILLIQQAPHKYQVHVQDLIKGDVYCDIQSVVVDKATKWTEIHFNYRGRTSVSLTPVASGSLTGKGSYIINLPLLGSSEVKVSLVFAQDGTARGYWRNMGYDGTFSIVKK